MLSAAGARDVAESESAGSGATMSAVGSVELVSGRGVMGLSWRNVLCFGGLNGDWACRAGGGVGAGGSHEG